MLSGMSDVTLMVQAVLYVSTASARLLNATATVTELCTPIVPF